jgi:hypothetical protein
VRMNTPPVPERIVGETLLSGRDAVHYPDHQKMLNTSLKQDWDLRSESRDPALPDRTTCQRTERTTNG